MKIVTFQPQYPAADSKESAEICLTWMKSSLENLQPEEAELILLPEYSTTPGMNDRTLLRQFAISEGESFIRFVSEQAARLQSSIIFSAAVLSESKWFNRTHVFDSTGTLVYTYDKVHLTDFEKNGLALTPGLLPGVYQLGSIKLGFCTCFDFYFPEYFLTFASENVDLILCPSYQRSESSDRIRSISQVRALDSGCYLIRSSFAMDRAGFGGCSLIAAPDGSILEDAGDEVSLLTLELDPKRKFVKPASFGQPDIEHQALIENRRKTTMPALLKNIQEIQNERNR